MDDPLDDPDACLLWTLARDSDGYGTLRRGGRTVRAHRWAWEQLVGPIPEGMVVMHLCDTPQCVRVDHLRLGTVADNNADARAKGRAKPPPARRRKDGDAPPREN